MTIAVLFEMASLATYLKLQKRHGALINGAGYTAKNGLNILGWSTLKKRKKRKPHMMFKIINIMISEYLERNCLKKNIASSVYNLWRSREDIACLPRTRTEYDRKEFAISFHERALDIRWKIANKVHCTKPAVIIPYQQAWNQYIVRPWWFCKKDQNTYLLFKWSLCPSWAPHMF